MTSPVEMSNDEAWLATIKWDKDGLVPAIAQDASTGDVLMFAWMNRESVRLTVSTGEVVYWSRSRNKLWHKGEESGHIQRVKDVRMDCDGDVLLIKVEQIGGIACHTGRKSCFFRKLTPAKQWEAVDAVLKNPSAIYRNA